MVNTVYKSGRMYVVWPSKGTLQTQHDGIDQVVMALGPTSAEHTRNIEAATEIVQIEAGLFLDQREINPLAFEPNDPRRVAAVQEYGKRAIYEVRVKLVGYADAEGRFMEEPFQAKTNRLEVPQAKELFPALQDTIEELVQTHQDIHFEVRWEFQLEYYAFTAIHHVRDDINSVEGRRALQFQPNVPKGSLDCTRVHTPKLDCSNWKFSYRHQHLTKYLAESLSETEVKKLYQQYDALMRKTK